MLNIREQHAAADLLWAPGRSRAYPLSGIAVDDGDGVDVSGLHWPRIEVAIGFVLGRSLPVDGCTDSDVLAAIEYVTPAIELTDGEIRKLKAVVIGRERHAPDGLDFTDIDAVLYSGYEGREVIVTRGNSGEVLGDRLTAIASRATTAVSPLGVPMRPGHVILSASCTAAVDVAAGDRFRAELAGVGSVSVEFLWPRIHAQTHWVRQASTMGPLNAPLRAARVDR